MRKTYFFLEKSPVYKDKYLIRPNLEILLPLIKNTDSHNVLMARLLSLSYAQFLRYSRDRLGADLIGRYVRHIIPYFNKTPEVKMLVKVLNLRMSLVVSEREQQLSGYEEEGVETPKDNENNSRIAGEV